MTEQEAYIAKLEYRIKWAKEQLRSLANEYVHRSHGCPYSEIDDEDLWEVIDILDGKGQNAG